MVILVIVQYCFLLLLGSIIYRSARGTKHFGYRQLEKELTEGTAPMQRRVTSVHPKRHDRRTDGLGFLHGRSGVSSHKVAPLASVNKQEEMLINFDDDCSSAPQATSAVTGTQHRVSQSNVDVLSLLDSSIADKYACLPPALGERQRVPYDPFEISEDLKNYASQTATPFHSSNINDTAPRQYDTSSLHHSWSSFDSFSSQDNDDVASPTAVSTSERMYGSMTASHAHAAGDAGTNTKTGSDTNLLTYANVPLRPIDENRGRQMANYSSRHSYSYSDADKSYSGRSRRRNRNDQLASREVSSDVNANSVVPRPVSIGDSVDLVSDTVSQLSVRNAAVASQSAAAISPLFDQALASHSAIWDEKSLSRHMKAAKKKMPNTGSVFYDAADDDCGYAAEGSSSSSWDWNSGSSAPPVPPRDYLREIAAGTTQSGDAIYANVGERNPNGVNYDASGTRQLAEVRPFVQASSDVYQNYSEFSQSSATDASHTIYANVREQSSAVQRGSRSSYTEATTRGDVDRSGDGLSTIQRVRRHVPAATVDECQLALVSCFGDVDSAVRHLKVEQLTRLAIAPRERCRMLLEACGWNLESAGSVLLHELSAGSPV